MIAPPVSRYSISGNGLVNNGIDRSAEWVDNVAPRLLSCALLYPPGDRRTLSAWGQPPRWPGYRCRLERRTCTTATIRPNTQHNVTSGQSPQRV